MHNYINNLYEKKRYFNYLFNSNRGEIDLKLELAASCSRDDDDAAELVLTNFPLTNFALYSLGSSSLRFACICLQISLIVVTAAPHIFEMSSMVREGEVPTSSHAINIEADARVVGLRPFIELKLHAAFTI
jgi:hypothetical protein